MQKPDFLTQLFEPARGKILRFFVLNNKLGFTAVEIARRAGVSPHVAKNEISALLKINVIKEEKRSGDSRVPRYSFDERSKYANALSAFVHEVSPEQYGEVERALRGTGRLTVIVLSGVFTGDLNRPADLIIVGDYVNEKRLEKAVKSFEPKYGREIRYALFSTPEFRYRLTIHDKLVRDTLDFPHRLLLNKNNLI